MAARRRVVDASPIGMKNTQLLITWVPNNSEHRWTKRGDDYRRRPYNFFRLKLRSHRTESYRISTQSMQIIAD